MGKKVAYTPRSRIKSILHMLFLRSRERASALKRDHSTCQNCGKKQSRAKGREVYVEVHHIDGVSWRELVDKVYEMLLPNPDKLVTLCKDCHKHIEEN